MGIQQIHVAAAALHCDVDFPVLVPPLLLFQVIHDHAVRGYWIALRMWGPIGPAQAPCAVLGPAGGTKRRSERKSNTDTPWDIRI